MGQSTKFEKNPVMDYKAFLSAAGKAKSGYDKKGNTNQKDHDGTKIDQDLQTVSEGGSKQNEKAMEKHSNKSMHDGKGMTGDTPQIKKFTSKHLAQIKKLDNSEEKKM